MINDKQKVALIDINNDTEQTIKDKLHDGFVILSITSLLPTYQKLLIIYATPKKI